VDNPQHPASAVIRALATKLAGESVSAPYDPETETKPEKQGRRFMRRR
jgi:hypothetical protein